MSNEVKEMGKGMLFGIVAVAAIGSIIALLSDPKFGKKLTLRRTQGTSKISDISQDAFLFI